jgi:hypothetical protein
MMQDTQSEDDIVFSKNETFGISEGLDDFDDFDIGPQIDEFDSIDNSVDFEVEEPITTSTSVNKFVIVGEREDYTKQYYNQELDTWVDSSNNATLFDDRNHAIEVLYDLDKSAFYTTRVMIKLMPTLEGTPANSNNFRKPIPEGMTVEQLVEEMEENEEEVECAWCNDLFEKSACHKEADFGWLCPSCEAAIKSRGETLSIQTNESFNSKETVDFDYGDLEVTLQGRKRDVDDWDERAVRVDYTYEVSKDDVATTIWENFITDKDVLDVPGGLEALEDDTAWANFLETHFDSLVDKYYTQLLDYYRDDAVEEYEANHSLEDYDYDAACDYYDSMREKLDIDKIDFSNCVDSSDMEIWGLEHIREDFYKAVLLKRFENVDQRGLDESQKVTDEMYDIDGMFTFYFLKNGSPDLYSWNVNLLRELGGINIEFEDTRYEDAVARVFNRKTFKEDVKEIHDLGNEYDGGYPAETPEVSDSQLTLCPECGSKNTFDLETGICIECGFN